METDGTITVEVNSSKDPLRLLLILRNVVGAGLTGSEETDRHPVLLKSMTTKQGSSLLSDYQRTLLIKCPT
jgi:hypothetical protein